MTATISADNGAGQTVPITVLSPYTAAWRSRNVVHDLISGGIGVSLIAPRPRSGTLQALYGTEAEADAAAQLHRSPTSFTLADDDAPSIGMTYVIDGEVSIGLDPDTLILWILSIDFQEVE